MARRKGFTLIELLVVIAIIALLTSILMPALNKVKEQARRSSCSTRVRQHSLSLNMYADENDSKMPLFSSDFLQDIKISTVNHMLSAGMKREMFYCPSNLNVQKYNDYFWMFNNKSWDPALNRFTDTTSYIVSGYGYIIENAQGTSPKKAITCYKKDALEKIWIKTNQELRPSEHELVVDLIMGVIKEDTKYGRDFEHNAWGIYYYHEVYDKTSHLKNEEEPFGGNIGFLDCHTEWRPFEPEIENGIAVARANGFFFW